MPGFVLGGRTLKADTLPAQAFSLTQAKRMEFSVYKNSLLLWTTSGDEELIGVIVKVSSVGFCAECEV